MQPTTEETPQTTGLFGLITPEQLAKQLNVTLRTVQRWESERVGPPRVKIGRQIFFRVSSVSEWLASREKRRSR